MLKNSIFGQQKLWEKGSTYLLIWSFCVLAWICASEYIYDFSWLELKDLHWMMCPAVLEVPPSLVSYLHERFFHGNETPLIDRTVF